MFKFEKTKWNKKYFFIATAVFAVMLLGKYYFFNKSAQFPYAQSNQDLSIVLSKNVSVERHFFTYVIKSNDVEGEAVLTPVSSDDAGKAIVLSQIVGTKNTFANSRAPYAGHITSNIECNTKKYVREQKFLFGRSESTILLAVTNDRHIFGVCTLEQVKYASIVWAFYDDKRKHVISVKLFKPVSDIQKIEESYQDILKTFNLVMAQP